MSAVTAPLLVGKRATYFNEFTGTPHYGTIAALLTYGTGNNPFVLMLYDAGSLDAHPIESIAVDMASAAEGAR